MSAQGLEATGGPKQKKIRKNWKLVLVVVAHFLVVLTFLWLGIYLAQPAFQVLSSLTTPSAWMQSTTFTWSRDEFGMRIFDGTVQFPVTYWLPSVGGMRLYSVELAVSIVMPPTVLEEENSTAAVMNAVSHRRTGVLRDELLETAAPLRALDHNPTTDQGRNGPLKSGVAQCARGRATGGGVAGDGVAGGGVAGGGVACGGVAGAGGVCVAAAGAGGAACTTTGAGGGACAAAGGAACAAAGGAACAAADGGSRGSSAGGVAAVDEEPSSSRRQLKPDITPTYGSLRFCTSSSVKAMLSEVDAPDELTAETALESCFGIVVLDQDTGPEYKGGDAAMLLLKEGVDYTKPTFDLPRTVLFNYMQTTIDIHMHFKTTPEDALHKYINKACVEYGYLSIGLAVYSLDFRHLVPLEPLNISSCFVTVMVCEL